LFTQDDETERPEHVVAVEGPAAGAGLGEEGEADRDVARHRRCPPWRRVGSGVT